MPIVSIISGEVKAVDRQQIMNKLAQLYRLRDEGKHVDVEIMRLERMLYESIERKVNGQRKRADKGT